MLALHAAMNKLRDELLRHHLDDGHAFPHGQAKRAFRYGCNMHAAVHLRRQQRHAVFRFFVRLAEAGEHPLHPKVLQVLKKNHICLVSGGDCADVFEAIRTRSVIGKMCIRDSIKTARRAENNVLENKTIAAVRNHALPNCAAEGKRRLFFLIYNICLLYTSRCV